MRSEKSLWNMITSLCSYGIAVILGIVTQSIFTKVVGLEYLGINGLFDNILAMLGIAEMGIGTAIICNLYKPIHDKDTEKIKSLMGFYKTSYRIIGTIICLIGVAIIPIIPSIVGEVHISENIIFLYTLALADVVASYFLVYKRSLLYAHQRENITNIVHINYLVIMNATLIFILVAFQNYVAYLVVKLIYRILENVVVSKIVDKEYAYVKENYEPLDKETKTEIFKKVKGMFIYKISSFVISGTDNIIISKFLGIISVGLYSNYALIINAVGMVFYRFFGSLTASIGDLLTENDKQKTYSIYRKILFLNVWVSGICAIGFLCVIQPFIEIFFGAKYILPISVVITLSVYLFTETMRRSTTIFKEAAGIYHQDKHISVLQAIINIVVSIILVQWIGMPGVFLGTIISQLFLMGYGYPKYIWKPLFGISYGKSIITLIKYTTIVATVGAFTYFIATLPSIENNILLFAYRIFVCIVIPNVCFLAIFHKKEEFRYYLDFVKQRIQRK